MKAKEIGLLVMKMQADDVTASDMRRFIGTLMRDEEVRRNAKLVSSLSGLDEHVRAKHCLATVMMLLSASALGPPEGFPPPNKERGDVTDVFIRQYVMLLGGPWKHHVEVLAGVAGSSCSIQNLQYEMRISQGKTARTLRLSDELASHIRVIEEFWGVQGLLVR